MLPLTPKFGKVSYGTVIVTTTLRTIPVTLTPIIGNTIPTLAHDI